MLQAIRRTLPALDPYTRQYLDSYVAYQLSRDEYVTNVTFYSLADAKEWLYTIGYEPQYLAAAKRHPDDPDWIEALSFRKVPTQHPPVDARITRRWDPKQCQYHVHLFDTGGTQFELFSHYELRPDFFRPTFNLERLDTHYNPVYGEDYLKGVASPNIDQLREIKTA